MFCFVFQTEAIKFAIVFEELPKGEKSIPRDKH